MTNDEREDHLRDVARDRQKADNQIAYDQQNTDARATQQISLQQAQLTYQRAALKAFSEYLKNRPKPKDDNPDV